MYWYATWCDGWMDGWMVEQYHIPSLLFSVIKKKKTTIKLEKSSVVLT